MGLARKRLKRADQQPVATHGNRFGAHGKEGVDGSSPSEGLKYLQLATSVAWLDTEEYFPTASESHPAGLVPRESCCK
jgi:hypothetical protein